jgi:tetratricopeptide (TPR) repeat protein
MSRCPVTYLVPIAQPSGVEMNAHLILDDTPTRQEQKLKTLSKYVQKYPSGWKKRLELAAVLYEMGRWEEAIAQYRQVLMRQRPLTIEVYLQLGKLLHLMGKEAEAIAVYQEALSLWDCAATLQHLKGLIQVCRGCSEQAIRMFESAAAIEPDNPAHWYALAQVHLNTESPVGVLRAFDAALSLNPNDIIALSQSYDSLLAVGNFQEARRRLERVLALAPNDCRAIVQLAAHRCYQGFVSGEEGKQTKQLIKTALALAPECATAHQVLSLYHLCRGKWEKALAVLLKFTEEHPNNPMGWYHYAQCLFHTGKSQAAADAILRAYALYQNDCEIYRMLCEILPAAGRLDRLCIESSQPPKIKISPYIPLLPRRVRGVKGEQEHRLAIQTTTSLSPHLPFSPTSLLQEMLTRFPQHWSVWVTGGKVLVEHIKDIERGCSVSAQAVQLQPQLSDAWFRHGRVLALAGRHREAVEALEQGWQQLPSDGGYLHSIPGAVWLGESYQALGDEHRSRDWWEKASHCAEVLMEFHPATAYYWQGRALLGLGNVQGAREAYRSSLKQHLPYPARSEVKEALQYL